MATSKSKRIGVILVLVIVFLVALNVTPAARAIKNFFYNISFPAQNFFWGAGHRVSGFLGGIGDINNLKKEIESLRSKNQELIYQNAQLINLAQENKTLREALGIGLEKEFKLSLTEVIGKDISQDSILVHRGARDGISSGMAVITGQKALVGRVSEVYGNFSRVTLISNKESSFNAEIQASCFAPGCVGTVGNFSEIKEGRDVSGVVKGKGNFKVFIDLIPQEKEIKEGDVIITSPLGGVFPKGLVVGQISKILKSDIDPFQQAQINPAFNIQEIESLFIILGY